MSEETFQLPESPFARAVMSPLVKAFRALNGRDPRPDDIAFYSPYVPLHVSSVHVSSRYPLVEKEETPLSDPYTLDYRTRQLVGMLYALKAVRKGDFTLSSGRKSEFYIDGRLAVMDPETLRIISFLMGEVISEYSFDSIGSPEGPGSCALLGSMLLGYTAVKNNMTISGFVVRKKAKEHGMAQIVEGRVGSRPVLIDDVATSGKALLHAIEHMPVKPIVAVVLLDRNEGAKEALAEVGVELKSILTMKDLTL